MLPEKFLKASDLLLFPETNFTCLKVFELNLRLCHLTCSQSKGPIKSDLNTDVCYALERYGVASWKEIWAETMQKRHFDRKWRITDWLKTWLLYCSSIKQAFQCFFTAWWCVLVLKIYTFFLFFCNANLWSIWGYLHKCTNHSNLEMQPKYLTKSDAQLNQNKLGTKNDNRVL